jgi:hypothetical protein
MSAPVLDGLRTSGFSPRLYWPEPEDPIHPVSPVPRLVVDGDVPLCDELKQQVQEQRDVLKASLLISVPPSWLVRLLNLYSGTSNPLQENTGRELPRPTLQTIAAAVAEAVGIDAREREKVLHEVKAAARTWEPGKVVPLRLGEPI